MGVVQAEGVAVERVSMAHVGDPLNHMDGTGNDSV